MEKDFFDVFPHLKVKKELEELLDMVFVTKVSMNPGRTHLRVYIESSRWIHKTTSGLLSLRNPKLPRKSPF